MQPQNQNQFNSVTKLSKALAASLFIVLPFVGLYIGYTFAPEKVVEVERVVVKEVDRMVEIPADLLSTLRFEYSLEDIPRYLFSDLVVGKLYNGWMLNSIDLRQTRHGGPGDTYEVAIFSNEITLTGSMVYSPDGMSYTAFIPSIASVKKLPLVDGEKNQIEILTTPTTFQRGYVGQGLCLNITGLGEQDGGRWDWQSELELYAADQADHGNGLYVFTVSEPIEITIDRLEYSSFGGCYTVNVTDIETI